MTNILSTVEQNIVNGIKSELGKLTNVGKAAVAKELSWMNGHPWRVLGIGIAIGALGTLAIWII